MDHLLSAVTSMYKHRYTLGHTQGVQTGVHQEWYKTEEQGRERKDSTIEHKIHLANNQAIKQSMQVNYSI